MTTTAEFLSADQNWSDETTVYWFTLGDEQYGIADCNGHETIVDADGAPLSQGPALERVRAACVVSDAIRNAAAGFSTAVQS